MYAEKHSILQSGQSSNSRALVPDRKKKKESDGVFVCVCAEYLRNKRNNEKNSSSIWPKRLGNTI